MKRLLTALLPLCLLTACTDIRTRLSPDVLAADAGAIWHFAAHTTQNDRLISADAPSPLLFPDALQNAAGAEISAGHLSVAVLSGNACTALPALMQEGLLAPACLVLYVKENACDALRNGLIPSAGMLRTAAETGQIPLRTADTVTGDLQSLSGITAVPCQENGRFALVLLDEEQVCGTLSADACRGLALLGRNRKTFVFAAGEQACSVTRTSLHLHAECADGRLRFTLAGRVHVTPACAEAEDVLREMLTAALRETAGECGADLLFLQERAVQGGIAEAAVCSRTQWRKMLMQADYQVQITA